MNPDMINGTFELAGSLFVWYSVVLLYRQKMVHGVSFWTIGFFAIWSGWNLFYYPHLNQWFSFFGGMSIGTANTVWVVQIVYYLYFYKGEVTSDV